LGGLLIALWIQVRAIGTPGFLRQRRRAAVGLTLLLAALGLFHAYARGWLDLTLFPPEEDGSWGAVSINGQPVSPREFYIGVRDQEVTGGRDGCNYWSYEKEPERGDGQRSIHTTLAGCEESPAQRGYWAVAGAPSAALRLRADGSLEISASGHRVLFRRCTWEKDPDQPGSQARICVIK
jgi:hypothetical protein